MKYYEPHDTKSQAKQSFSIVPMQLFFDKRLNNNRTAQLVYVALAFFADAKTGLVGFEKEGELITPSCEKMAKILNITPSSFSKGLKLLKDFGWVRVAQKRMKKSWVYYLQFPTDLKLAVGERGYPAELTGLLSDDEYARVQASRQKTPGVSARAKPKENHHINDLSGISDEDFESAVNSVDKTDIAQVIAGIKSKRVTSEQSTRNIDITDAISAVASYFNDGTRTLSPSELDRYHLSYDMTEKELRDVYSPRYNYIIDNWI